MQTFLMIVGGLVVGLLLFLVGTIIALRLFVGSKLKMIKEVLERLAADASTAVPPFQLKLTPLPEGASQDERVSTLAQELQIRGFESAGDFVADLTPLELNVRLLAQRDLGMQAAIYSHPQAGVWVDLVTRYTDGRVVCDTSLRDHLMESMPKKQIRFHPAASASEVYEQHVALRPPGDWRHIPTADLPSLFESIYAEELEWRGSRGGPTPEEIARVSERDGTTVTQEMIDTIRGRWQEAFHEHRLSQLREAVIQDGTFRDHELDQLGDRLLFIYDGMPVSAVGDALESVRDFLEAPLDDVDDEAARQERHAREVADQVTTVGARVAFRELSTPYLGKEGFQFRTALPAPLPADLYLLPEGDPADEDDGDDEDDNADR
jgi:hypothetical protein